MPIDERFKTLRREVLFRYRHIELIALWEGRVTTRHLCTSFGIQRQQASRDLKGYRELAPNNLHYDMRRKGYIPTEQFTPKLISGSIDEYLNLLESLDFPGGSIDRLTHPGGYTTLIHEPPRRADPVVIRSVVEACRTEQRLEIEYASFNKPQGKLRVISPHALVSSGHRWHVRAYCEENRAFRDFVISRIRKCGELIGEPLKPAAHDNLWHQRIELSLIPNPDLTPAQQEMIRFERCIEGKRLTLTPRAATAIYLLQLMQIPEQPPASSEAKRYPLTLENYRQIEGIQFSKKEPRRI